MKEIELDMKKNVAKTEQVLVAQTIALEKYNENMRKDEVRNVSTVSLLLCAAAVVSIVSCLYFKTKTKRYRLD